MNEVRSNQRAPLYGLVLITSSLITLGIGTLWDTVLTVIYGPHYMGSPSSEGVLSWLVPLAGSLMFAAYFATSGQLLLRDRQWFRFTINLFISLVAVLPVAHIIANVPNLLTIMTKSSTVLASVTLLLIYCVVVVACKAAVWVRWWKIARSRFN
jgi:hypothetical protein